MIPESLNLLPPERRRAAKREYFIRLATVAVLALAAVVIGTGALLVPSYLYVNQEIAARQARISALNAQLASGNGKEIKDRLAMLTDRANYLARLASTTSATAAIRGVLAAPAPGITLTGFTYTAPAANTSGKMDVRGVASTRETLRAYDEALTALPFVTNAELPISAYAKETHIPFVITLTGSLTP